ncbi:hypothetical protein T07_6062 [Trichinella nelsoni]|uniref:Uncharacterized protein n=1 Tax=Trichinella nelsoni TaxID=6336 RepID=A0A0V0S5R3_9BILA|nr:hypothetical protein T07_6062 [Trichinella nelsoni]
MLLDDDSGFQLRPALWELVIASACSRMKRWEAVRSVCNFSAFISLSHSILLATVILSLKTMMSNSAAEISILRGSFPFAVNASTLRSMWSEIFFFIIHLLVVAVSSSSTNFLTTVYGLSKRSFSLRTATS